MTIALLLAAALAALVWLLLSSGPEMGVEIAPAGGPGWEEPQQPQPRDVPHPHPYGHIWPCRVG